MSPLADMLIRQHGSLDDASRHAMLMFFNSDNHESKAKWQFAAAEIRAEMNTTTYTGMTASELKFIALKITQTEDAPLSVCWAAPSGWIAR